MVAGSIFVVVLLACALLYLAFVVPKQWFPHEAPRTWSATDLAVSRGSGRLVNNELFVTPSDASGVAIVAVTSDFRSSEYATITWSVDDLPENTDVRLLWTNDVRPDKVNSAPIEVRFGHTLPVVVADDAAWLGRIKGLAIAIRVPAAQRVRFRGVTASPAGAFNIVEDRFRDWFAFEGWNGASINTIVGGTDNQPVRLPIAIAVLVALSTVAFAALRHLRPARFTIPIGTAAAVFFLAGWFLLDVRWASNLVRQERSTAALFHGKDMRERHLASDDAQLYAFIEKARAVMPSTPTRIIVVADADYFRGRAAYHLYPHNAYFDPRGNAMPPASTLRPGDWLLVFQRKGIQYDRSQGKLRWDGDQTVNAELKLLDSGNALFLIH